MRAAAQQRRTVADNQIPLPVITRAAVTPRHWQNAVARFLDDRGGSFYNSWRLILIGSEATQAWEL